MKALEITTIIGCPNNCFYCPQDLLKSRYEGQKRMTVSDFLRILSNAPKDVRIDFTGFSESFVNTDASRMMAIASERGYAVVLYTTLVGLKEEDLETLKGVAFQEVVFHQYPTYNPDVFNRDMERLKATVNAPFRLAEITPQWEWTRAGNVKEYPYQEGRFQCRFAARDFDHNVVLPNGDVYLCCQDYGLKHKIGNLYDTHFDSLNRSVVRALSAEENSDVLCRRCELFIKI